MNKWIYIFWSCKVKFHVFSWWYLREYSSFLIRMNLYVNHNVCNNLFPYLIWWMEYSSWFVCKWHFYMFPSSKFYASRIDDFKIILLPLPSYTRKALAETSKIFPIHFINKIKERFFQILCSNWLLQFQVTVE